MFRAAKKEIRNDGQAQTKSVSNLAGRRCFRDFLIFACFCILTVAMTWPWVKHLRSAVADRGDPYMIAWTLWWDYHQTFHDPLHLFEANVFYPYHYALAFSENDYGIALLFFPLFAAGVKPLTVNSIATFLGFAFCGYGAFRLARTLTGQNSAAWIAGIVFAFIPYRFHLLSHLHYLFAGWIPLLLEALVLFARQRTWRRAIWLGVAFLLNGLSCISWFIMTIVPLALTLGVFLFMHESLRRDRDFWLRGALAVGVAGLALLPFLWPYYRVSVLYGLRWQPWEYALNSPSLIHWFKGEPRNRIWQNFGSRIEGAHMLFPGMLAPLFAMAALQFGRVANARSLAQRAIPKLIDFVIIASAIIATLSLGYGDAVYRLLGVRLLRLNERSFHQAAALFVLALALKVVMLFVRRDTGARRAADPNRRDAIAVGLVWTVSGFLASLGANFFINRWLHDYLLLYQSIRIPARAAMICYLGLAILAGVGAARLGEWSWKLPAPRRVRTVILALVALAFLFELHASPLRIEIGEVDPSTLALRLAQTPMKGGLVELPSTGMDATRHFYMLRAADHARPLVNATSSFISPLTDEINRATDGKIVPNFMTLLESIPASYLVVHNDRLLPGWQTDYEIFLVRALKTGRLRFINRFDGHDDLYAVVKTEPDTLSEAAIPFPLVEHQWSEKIEEDESNILAPAARSQSLYRIYLATSGTMPRYNDFMKEVKTLGRGVFREAENEDETFDRNLREFADLWVGRDAFQRSFHGLDESQYVDRLLANAGVTIEPHERASLIESATRESRAAALLRIVADRRFIDKENDRSLVLLNYFAYLHRNPGDPPDRDLSGFNFWIQDLAREHNPGKISVAFRNSIEFHRRQEGR